MHTPIGYMKPKHVVASDEYGFVIVCKDCTPMEVPWVPIYKDNIYPYNQRCAICNKQLVYGQSPAWPELYS